MSDTDTSTAPSGFVTEGGITMVAHRHPHPG